jgi:membrane fusion protein, copper/silver efflux system
MKPNRKILLTLILLGFTSACVKEEVKEVSTVHKVNDSTLKIEPEAMKNLVVDKVKMSELPERLDLMGKVSVTEDRTTVVPARVAGRLDSIALASGETVKKGQAMATLFSPDFVSAREEYLQALKQSRNVTTEGESVDFGNFSQLARKKLVTMGLSPQDIANLQDSEKKNANFIVRSPRDGVIIDKKAMLGNLVNVGDNLFTVADISKVWFSGDLYSEDLPKVHKDQDVVIDEIPGGDPIHGTISFISPIVDPTARTIKIRALMDNLNGLLRADMYVHGGILLSKKQALLVPTTAIVRIGELEFVYKKISDNVFQRVRLKTKEEFQTFTAIEEGLTEGDEVITDGGLFLEAALNP